MRGAISENNGYKIDIGIRFGRFTIHRSVPAKTGIIGFCIRHLENLLPPAVEYRKVFQDFYFGTAENIKYIIVSIAIG